MSINHAVDTVFINWSADFCYHKFKKVYKAGVRKNTEISLFKALLIKAIT